jgi:hypothetical protein
MPLHTRAERSLSCGCGSHSNLFSGALIGFCKQGVGGLHHDTMYGLFAM